MVIAALLGMAIPPGRAGEPVIEAELNKLSPNGEACRAYLVLKNGTGAAFEALKLDLVMFDPEGVVAKRLVVEAAPLAAGKTSLKVFDIQALSCKSIGRVLLNDVIACADGAGARPDCLALISPSARGTVGFIK